jgi:hypothetical protein
VVHDADYLDAIFSAIRAFAHDLETSKRWLGRAEQSKSRSWRLSFLHEARAALERAPAHLATVDERLAALGPIDALPAPLDRIQGNLATMRADLAAQRQALHAAEAKLEPLGQA